MNPEHSQPSQAAQILDHLRKGHSLTQHEAMRHFGCMRLGARVWELNQNGAGIECRMITVPSRNGRARVAQYFIPQSTTPTNHETKEPV